MKIPRQEYTLEYKELAVKRCWRRLNTDHLGVRTKTWIDLSREP